MKKTFSLLLSLLSFVSFGDELGPTTELNDVPGTATLREMFKAGGGDGSATTNDLRDATNLLAQITESAVVRLGMGSSVTNVASGYVLNPNRAVAIGERARTTTSSTTSQTSSMEIDSRAVAIGFNAEASGTYDAAQSVAIGANAKSTGAASVSLGGGAYYEDDSGVITNTDGTVASGDFGIAIGYQAKALGNYSTALGYRTRSTGLNSVSIGGNTTDSGNNSTSIGFDATSGVSSVAIGLSSGSGDYDVVIGESASSAGQSVVIGRGASASNVRSTVVGSGAASTMNDGLAVGTQSSALGAYASAVGYRATASGSQSLTFGTQASTDIVSSDSVAIGTRASAFNSKNSVLLGLAALATNSQLSVVIGNSASGKGGWKSVAIGDSSSFASVYNIALGSSATATGPGGIAIGSNYETGGDKTTASGYYALAVGNGAQGTQESSVALGYKAVSSRARAVQLGEGMSEKADTLQFRHVPIVTETVGSGGTYVGTLDSRLVIPQISASNKNFSDAVLAVQIDTNTVAQIGELKAFFDDLPTGAVGTSLGGIILAILSAAAYLKKKTALLESDGKASDTFATDLLGKQVAKEAIDAEVISKGTAPDAHLEAPTDERLKLILADNSVAYDSAKALPYKLTSVIGDRVIATMTLTSASTDITLPTIAANDTTVKDFILDVTNAYAVEGVATDAGINIPRTDFKLVTRDGESLTDVTTVKAGKSAFICFTQKSPVVVDGTTYPCWCVIQLPFGDPS